MQAVIVQVKLVALIQISLRKLLRLIRLVIQWRIITIIWLLMKMYGRRSPYDLRCPSQKPRDTAPSVSEKNISMQDRSLT